MRRTTRALAVVAILSLLVLPGASASEGASYTAPFEQGPSSGDSWTLNQGDADSGRIFLGRAYPIPGVISCAGGNAQEKFQVTHEVTAPITEITASFDEALVDNYAWVTLTLKDADGEWLARARQRGPVLGGGDLTAEVFDNLPTELVPAVGDTVTVEFGLEVASSCANANGGTVRFTEITVS